ncbi:AAA family ATPase, partial [Streptacidiphilus melanogenes]|uniref:AAA family ATPase n=1 Tax=Streptacidiphilus melanogenes TaxID=411235 RepID=UPI001364BA34
MLYGRGPEQAAIDELLRAAVSERRSGVLVLRGEPGIGKTALLDHADTCAQASGGWTVLRAAGVEAESDLPFAALQLLLAPALDGLAALPEPQRRALERAFGLADPDAAAAHGNRLLVGLGVLGLLAELAESGPVLCLVDDLQWCDAASTEALVLAARRLRAEGVVVLFAAREGEGTAPAAGLPERGLVGLDDAAAAQVLARHVPDADEVTRRQLLELAHGNPLALRELPGAEGDAGGPLPLAGRLQLAYHGQLSRLPAATQTLLLVAAAEESGELSVVLEAAERLGASAQDLQPAESAALVGVTGAGGRLAFRHPLLRSAVLGRAPLAQRLAAHAALAAVLDGREVPGGDAAVRRAWHLVQAAPGPDESVAATLEGVAETAAARGGPSGAAAAYERAALLSPAPEDVTRRLVLAAEAAAEAGEVVRAESLAGRAHARKPSDPVMLAHVMFIRGVAQFWRGAPDGAHRLMLETADLVAGAHPVPTARVLLHALDVARTLDEPAVAETLHRLADLKLPPEDGLAPVVSYLLAASTGRTGHAAQPELAAPDGRTRPAGQTESSARSGRGGQAEPAERIGGAGAAAQAEQGL